MEFNGSMISDDSSRLPKVKKVDFSVQDPILSENLKEKAVNWKELPEHLTYLIADKCAYIADLIRFGSVCVYWQSIYTEIRKSRRQKSHRQPPLLMLPTALNPDEQTRSFYNHAENRISKFQAQVPHNVFCQGSSYGWLVIQREDNSVSLLNPFLSENNEIQLPPLTAFEHGGYIYNDYMKKAVLSSNPLTDPDFIVMAIHGGSRILAYCRPGDKVWTNLVTKFGNIYDVVYLRDQFYAIGGSGGIFAFDCNHSHPIASLISPDPLLDCDGKYIVELAGELLQITKYLKDLWGDSEPESDDSDWSYIIYKFEVHKLDTTGKKWVKVTNIGDHVLFLGDNSSMSISTLDFPEYKPNCIYYTDDYHDGYEGRVYRKLPEGPGPHAMGIFSLEKGLIGPHYKMESDVIIPAPIWIEPMW